MGPVSAEIALVALDDRPIDGAAGPAARSYCAGEEARHEEREEKTWRASELDSEPPAVPREAESIFNEVAPSARRPE